MIGELSGLPNGVIGFEATGELKAKDCRDVILLVAVCPAIGEDGRPVQAPVPAGSTGGGKARV